MNRVGLIEQIHADFGVGEVGGHVSGVRGRLGHYARPLDDQVTVDTSSLSNGRRALLCGAENTSGFLLELPELRRNNAELTFIAHVRMLDASTDFSFSIVHLPRVEDTDHVLWLATGSARIKAVGTNGAGVSSTVQEAGTLDTSEHVLAAVRGDNRLELYRDGVSIGTQSLALLGPRPESASVGIGVRAVSSPDSAFFGVIRRVDVYGRALSTAEVLARSNQYLGT